MLQVGERPMIDHIVLGMVAAGVRDVTVVTGYLGSVVETHLAGTCRVPVVFVRQSERNGTGGALGLVRSAVGNEPFLLSWGDVVTADDHYKMIVDDWRPESAAVMGVNELEDVSRGSSVVFDGELNVTAIVEKPQGKPPSQWNSAGIMALGPQLWPHIAALTPSPRGELELTDALAALVEAGESVRAVPLRGFWFDVGTPESLSLARTALGNPPGDAT